MLYEYGKANWEILWEKLEQEGNVGLDYVINPHLYPEIIKLLSEKTRSFIVDFGCGTNIMGIQLLYGYAQSIPALKDSIDLDQARFNTKLYLGLDGQQELVNRSQSYLKDIGNPVNISTIEIHVGKETEKMFDVESVDFCFSRQFLMHLSIKECKEHVKQVFSMLKRGGYYIFTTLNPEYEILKTGRNLKNGEGYEFLHGKIGEYGTLYHYYKTVKQYESILTNFKIEKKIACTPITDIFRSTHERYYNPEVPIAFVYVLKRS